MREPNPLTYMLCAAAWLILVQTPFAILVGNEWILKTLPTNLAIFTGLYAIAIPYLVAGFVYFLAWHRYQKTQSQEPSNDQ